MLLRWPLCSVLALSCLFQKFKLKKENKQQINHQKQIMVKNGQGFYDILTYLPLGLIQHAILRLQHSSSYRQHPYECFFISEKELDSEVIWLSYD